MPRITSPRACARIGLLLGVALAACAGNPAWAQHMDYDAGAGTSDEVSVGEGARDPASGGIGHRGHAARSAGGTGRTKISPYLQVSQNLLAQITPGNDVVTYTALAAGVDMTLAGRNTQGAVALRYERRFVEKGSMGSSDTVSGLARVKHDLVPRTLSVEAGAMAARTRVEASGAASLNPVTISDAVSQVYSVYAGPALSTHAGVVGINASYMAGYTKLDNKHAYQATPSAPRVDVFDHSVSQSAQLSAGVKPGEVLPVGLTASTGFAQEDISNLDQRVRDLRAGLQATLPVTRDVALVGDVGWEKVTVSSRDAVRDVSGTPVVGSDGRYVTDHSGPRRIAYQTSGLTWDVGVMWRPSRRTSLSAYYGRRYDSSTYYGSFSYAPNARSALSISVFDGISGFGSSVNDALKQMPTDLETTRDPLSGGIGGCGIGQTSGACINGALGSVASSVFRGRGVNATYGFRMGHLHAGIGAGYMRRKFIGARGTVLASANGTVDESYYVSAGLSGAIDRRSSFSVNAYDAWFKAGSSALANSNAYGASASYYRQLTDRLVGTAAVGLDGVNRQTLPDELAASGLVGLRYNF